MKRHSAHGASGGDGVSRRPGGRTATASRAAAGTLGLVCASGLLAGCAGSTAACPEIRVVPRVTADATAWVRAHPGEADRMGACVLRGDGSGCTAADAAARARSVRPPAVPSVVVGVPGPGRYRVRIVLLAADRHVVLDTTGPLVVRHLDDRRCHTVDGDAGAASVAADGRVTSSRPSL
jgi:hypothetical protein